MELSDGLTSLLHLYRVAAWALSTPRHSSQILPTKTWEIVNDGTRFNLGSQHGSKRGALDKASSTEGDHCLYTCEEVMGFAFGANELMEERELPLQDVTTRARRLLLPVGVVMTYEECSALARFIRSNYVLWVTRISTQR